MIGDKTRLVLYGHFGQGNIGNDSSLEAILHALRKIRPSAKIICVCTGPETVESRFGVTALPIDISELRNIETSNLRFIRLITRVFFRIIDELTFWIRRPFWFRSVEQFVIVGTGAVDDMAVRWPWNAPYDLYKWCKAAKMGGAKVVFMSVGVGPILNRVSRFLMLKALRMADYRSYREVGALEYLQVVNFKARGDLIYPDLVFGLSDKYFGSIPKISRPAKTVGLGVLNYYGWKHDPAIGESVYQEYIAKLMKFLLWLLDKGYYVRILIGDSDDRRPVNELMAFVRRNAKLDQQDNLIYEEPISVENLFNQIARTDIVVASRFHNVLCSLMLERPVISLGYHKKNDDLMREMGLEEYCHHIEKFSVEWLIEHFISCDTVSDQTIRRIHQRLGEYHNQLEEQYDKVFSVSTS